VFFSNNLEKMSFMVINIVDQSYIHVALITSLMQSVAGSVVTNDRHHGARRGMYSALELYVLPNPVANAI